MTVIQFAGGTAWDATINSTLSTSALPAGVVVSGTGAGEHLAGSAGDGNVYGDGARRSSALREWNIPHIQEKLLAASQHGAAWIPWRRTSPPPWLRFRFRLRLRAIRLRAKLPNRLP